MQPISGDSFAHLLEPLRRFAVLIGYVFEVKAIPGGAEGQRNRNKRRIAVEETSERFSPNAQIAVGIHELAHALVLSIAKSDPKLCTTAGRRSWSMRGLHGLRVGRP